MFGLNKARFIEVMNRIFQFPEDVLDHLYTKSTLPFTELCYFDGITIVTTSCLLDKFEMSMMTMMIIGRSL